MNKLDGIKRQYYAWVFQGGDSAGYVKEIEHTPTPTLSDCCYYRFFKVYSETINGIELRSKDIPISGTHWINAILINDHTVLAFDDNEYPFDPDKDVIVNMPKMKEIIIEYPGLWIMVYTGKKARAFKETLNAKNS